MTPHYEPDDVLIGPSTPSHRGAAAPSAEVGLWRAVVLEQLWLATRPLAPEPEVTATRTGAEAVARREYLRQHNAHSAWQRARMENDGARVWLLDDKVDFPMTCHLAHWNPENIRKRARSLADRGWPCFLVARPDYVQICIAGDVQLAEEAELFNEAA